MDSTLSAALNSAMSSMYKYRVSRIWQELEALGKLGNTLNIDDLADLDQYHYLSTQAINTAAAHLELTPSSTVLDIGSGVGGTARYLASKYNCQATALELQPHLHAAAVALTDRCQLSNQVECLVGDFLELDQLACGDRTYDAWISLLVFLHIQDRATIFANGFKVLKPGGRFYIEDYYARQPLSDREVDTLTNVVACPYLPSRDRYLADLESAGFVVLEFEDVTQLWQPWVQDRLDRFAANRVEYTNLHGAEMVDAQTNFYQAIANLFAGGNVGGARIWGKSPN